MVRRLCDLENWPTCAQRGLRRVPPGQYWRVKLGPHAEDDYYLTIHQYLQSRPAEEYAPRALGSNNVYPKGALVPSISSVILGPSGSGILQAYLTQHALGNATSDDLRQSVLDATARISTGSGVNGSTTRGTPGSW